MENLNVMNRNMAARWRRSRSLNGWLLGASLLGFSLAGLGACSSSGDTIDLNDGAGLTRLESLANLAECESTPAGLMDELLGLGVNLPGAMEEGDALAPGAVDGFDVGEPGAAGDSDSPGTITVDSLTKPADYHDALTVSSDGTTTSINAVAEIANTDEVVVRRISEDSEEIKVCRVPGATKPGSSDVVGESCPFADSGEAKTVCGEGFYCKAEGNSCGDSRDRDGRSGTCEARPEACNMIFAPVAGCDGEVYGNACLAAGAGVSVFLEFFPGLPIGGPEPIEDPTKPGVPGATCAYGSEKEAAEVCGVGAYCKAPEAGICAGSRGFEGGVSGTCAARSEICSTIYAPVRGCNGETYENACSAAGAGVNVAESLALN